jgi:transposase InsO family protein
VESFNGKARDELFAREIFDSALEARVLYEDWRLAYNLHRPHRALGLQPPAVFAAAFNNQKLSPALDS